MSPSTGNPTFDKGEALFLSSVFQNTVSHERTALAGSVADGVIQGSLSMVSAAAAIPIDRSRSEAIDRLKEDLVLGCHILERAGQGSGIAGHLTARLPGDQSFWSYQWHQAFEEVGYDDIIEADFELKTITGKGRVNPTLHIHTQIYAARPDVRCIVHTHGPNAVALGVTGNNLEADLAAGRGLLRRLRPVRRVRRHRARQGRSRRTGIVFASTASTSRRSRGDSAASSAARRSW